MSKKLVILIATGLFPPDIGGPATYSKILAEELPVRGFEVKVLSFGEVRKYPKIIRHLIYFCQVFWRGRSTDIIYAQDPVSVGLPVMLACYFLRRNYWLKVVGDYAWEQGCQRSGVTEMLDTFSTKKSGYGFLVWVLKKIQTCVAKRAKKIIVPSQYLKEIVGNWGIGVDKISVVYNAFEGKELNLTRDQARLELGLDLVDKILISAGRLVPWKGFDTLIELMPEILSEFPCAKLLIVGDGPEENNLKNKILQSNLSSSVKMLGRLDQMTLLKYLRASDLFVLNTAYEGFSHQLLEVMSLGTIALVTDIGGNPELISNKDELMEYNNQSQIIDAIIKLLKMIEDPTKQEEIRKQLQIVARSFTRARMVDDLVTLFKKYE